MCRLGRSIIGYHLWPCKGKQSELIFLLLHEGGVTLWRIDYRKVKLIEGIFDSETNHYRMSLIIVYAFCSLFEIQPCPRCLFCIFWLTQWKLLICSPSAFKRTRHSQMTFKWQIDLTAKNSSKRLFWFTFYMLFFKMCKVIAKWSGQKQNHHVPNLPSGSSWLPCWSLWLPVELSFILCNN